MELHAYTRTISELLSVNRKYVVPRFQREYSWVKEQINELWYDVISNIKVDQDFNYTNNEYFIGSLVLVGDETGREMQIVDGQQRLTTLTICLSVLCECFKSNNQADLAEALFENYIEGRDDDGKKFFKLINETPKPFFQKNIQHINKADDVPQTQEEKNLLAAYKEISVLASKEKLEKYFSLQIKSNEEYSNLLKAIRDQVLRFLKIIFITVNDEDEAYTIFETLNARGMNLSFVDLIKNKLFKALNDPHPNDDAKDNWKAIRAILMQRNGVGTIETFMRHWWVSKYAYVSNENLYKSFISRWRKGDIDPAVFINELKQDAELYVCLSSPIEADFPQMEDKPIFHSLNAIKLFGITQCRPFLLALLKAKQQRKLRQKDLLKALRVVENFHFVFNAVCSLRPSGIEGAYSKAARLINSPGATKVSNGTTIDQLCALLSNRKPEATVFIENFRDIVFTDENTKQKRLVQYIINKFEMKRHNGNEYRPNSLSLEHVLPQSSGEQKEIGMIGNIIPLSKELNELAGDKPLDEKVAIYEQSEFKLTEEFVCELRDVYNGHWDAQAITFKTDRLAGEAYMTIWNH
ncbi:DUF262 domain-containing HNH endonuclease family protein [Leclercia adecarboxylata]|uniref:DUF262 domain-containing protein n=1 Tax=Leclercia adecarboxylata TaxID=83655 RepID=UPI001CBEEA45|nr:DUF262 domain-containing protein [Leclercia adecarboxylata]MBZ3800021.1 DUF262 domain-containing HNH endonuclease family protein [Leclercia adecarboxylata]MBZ3804240.1 DUF262 domain-containing HNH endonuclease family protein [Leclercia adecarboxylata]